MRHTILITLALLFSLTLFGQRGGGGKTPEQRVERDMARLESQLQLTEQERTELRAAFTEFYNESEQYRGQSNHEAMMALVQNRDRKVAGILKDPAQYREYERLMVRNQKRMTSQANQQKQNMDKPMQGNRQGGGQGRRKGG